MCSHQRLNLQSCCIGQCSIQLSYLSKVSKSFYCWFVSDFLSKSSSWSLLRMFLWASSFSFSSLKLNPCLEGPHRLDPRNPLPAHFSLWPSIPHVHPLACGCLCSLQGPNRHLYDAESEFVMTFFTQTSHLPHPSPGPISQAPQIQRVQNLTHCHSSIPSAPPKHLLRMTFLRKKELWGWEWVYRGLQR